MICDDWNSLDENHRKFCIKCCSDDGARGCTFDTGIFDYVDHYGLIYNKEIKLQDKCVELGFLRLQHGMYKPTEKLRKVVNSLVRVDLS